MAESGIGEEEFGPWATPSELLDDIPGGPGHAPWFHNFGSSSRLGEHLRRPSAAAPLVEVVRFPGQMPDPFLEAGSSKTTLTTSTTTTTSSSEKNGDIPKDVSEARARRGRLSYRPRRSRKNRHPRPPFLLKGCFCAMPAVHP